MLCDEARKKCPKRARKKSELSKKWSKGKALQWGPRGGQAGLEALGSHRAGPQEKGGEFSKETRPVQAQEGQVGEDKECWSSSRSLVLFVVDISVGVVGAETKIFVV